MDLQKLSIHIIKITLYPCLYIVATIVKAIWNIRDPVSSAARILNSSPLFYCLSKYI